MTRFADQWLRQIYGGIQFGLKLADRAFNSHKLSRYTPKRMAAKHLIAACFKRGPLDQLPPVPGLSYHTVSRVPVP